MADARRPAPRLSHGAPPRPPTLGPRLLTQTLALVTRRGRRRVAGAAATCATAAEHRSRVARQDGSGPDAAGRHRDGETLPGADDLRERAHAVVASRTTRPDDLASLLAMLDLRPGPDARGPARGGRRPPPAR
ncbi:hypothetical protein ABZY44_35490 [Streptomyces sp. NPDC006544]|uniref:hypothetical protein n=1 Tax=Streptomyces sp. NPDC006544 TaxID=3154583 RepID=UPI0033A681B6